MSLFVFCDVFCFTNVNAPQTDTPHLTTTQTYEQLPSVGNPRSQPVTFSGTPFLNLCLVPTVG